PRTRDGSRRGGDGALVTVHRFEAMGCAIVVGGATQRERAAVEALFRHYDAVFSRFVPASELNAVNAAAGRPVTVSPLFSRVLAVALDAAAQTAGLVDPTLGAQLEAAGYDRDFAELDAAAGLLVFMNTSRERWRSIRAHEQLLRLPA